MLGVEASPGIWENIGSAVGTIAVGLLAVQAQKKAAKATEKAAAARAAQEMELARLAAEAQIAAMQAQPSMLSRTYAGLPLWAWIAVPGIGIAGYFFTKSRRFHGRRRR